MSRDTWLQIRVVPLVLAVFCVWDWYAWPNVEALHRWSCQCHAIAAHRGGERPRLDTQAHCFYEVDGERVYADGAASGLGREEAGFILPRALCSTAR